MLAGALMGCPCRPNLWP